MSAEQTPDIETVTSIVLDSLHYADHHGGMSMLSLSRHVAQALAPVLAAAVREAEQRAQVAEAALRWIADEPSIEDCAPDCMPRAACQRSDLGHMFCGFCVDCNEPRHHCGHTVDPPEAPRRTTTRGRNQRQGERGKR